MKETKVRGLKITFDDENIDIENAYKIRSVDKMKEIIEEVCNKMDFCWIKRTMRSMTREWCARSRLYRWGLKSMKDYHIQNDGNIFQKFIYYLLGFEKIKIIEKIKQIIKKVKTNQAENKYYKYIEQHRKYMVQAYIEMLACPVILELGDEVLNKLKHRVLTHDLSKYENEEFGAYRKHYYPINKQEKEDNLENFERAWQHHWNNNPHHWQYRRNNTEFSKENITDVVNVLENVCDWLAIGYDFNDRPYQYYEKVQETIELCPAEREFLEYIIYHGVDLKYVQAEMGVKNDE